MHRLTEDEIKAFNDREDVPFDQGIYLQPYGIPTDVKTHVIYGRYRSGGYSGGGYWEDSKVERFSEKKPQDAFLAFDIALTVICPEISFLHYRIVRDGLLRTADYSDGHDYYGNSSDYEIEYIVLDELYKRFVELGYKEN